MSRLPKGGASAAAATTAVEPAAPAIGEAASDPAANAFNGADPAAFDHDHDGKPGGSTPAEPSEIAERQLAVVLLRPFEGVTRGMVVTGSVSRIAQIPDDAKRIASDHDLAVAGRNVRPL